LRLISQIVIRLTRFLSHALKIVAAPSPTWHPALSYPTFWFWTLPYIPLEISPSRPSSYPLKSAIYTNS
jgi:hypothetical protein